MLKRIATSAMHFALPHAEKAAVKLRIREANQAGLREEDDDTKRGFRNTRQWSARFKVRN
jgi:hypothetical protein